MKKIIFILLAIIALGCKKTKNDSALPADTRQQEVSLEDCDDLYKEMENLGTMVEVQQWLNENGHLICDNKLEHCIEPYHVIDSQTDFEIMAGRHPENNSTIKFYTMTISEIESKIADDGAKCYEKYIGFVFNGNTMELKFEPYKTTESMYSIPFITGLRQSLSLDNDSELQFTKSFENSTQTTMKVIFKVRDSNGDPHYYNITQDPRVTLL